MHKYSALFLVSLLFSMFACGGGGGGSNPAPTPPAFTYSLSTPRLKVFQTGQSSSVNVNVTRNTSTGPMTLTVSGLPSGATSQTSGFGSTDAGSLTIASGTAAAGNYTVGLALTDGQNTVTQSLPLTIGVSLSVDTATTGQIAEAMSTSFQPAEWDYQLFQNLPSATTPLNNLAPQHIRIQAVSDAVPQKSATTWDFTELNAILNPVFSVADHSPEFQIAVAPTFLEDTNGHLPPANFQAFADYSAQLVRYYNTGGFVASGNTYASTAGYPITYWGIFNEPNYNNLTPAEYTTLYNTTVPEMQAVDPSIKFVALELGDAMGQDTSFMPPFVSGVTAQVDVLATHFYSTCNQKDTDAQLFNNIPFFANGVSYLYSELQTNPALVNVPVWITENNVNADFDKGGGISACNGGTFTIDARGSSAYFAAWRPYMFSQAGKAGNKLLHQWVFAGDVQYGEIDDTTGKPRLSYWVDKALSHYFPAPPGATLLHYSSTDDPELETLAAKNPDGSVIVMIANHALVSTSDNNGAGAPRSVSVDISQLGTFTTAKLLTINASTDLVNGPTEASITLAPTMEVDFGGYGVAFLTLQ
jgi:Glycosyl hydrolase catalytic core